MHAMLRDFQYYIRQVLRIAASVFFVQVLLSSARLRNDICLCHIFSVVLQVDNNVWQLRDASVFGIKVNRFEEVVRPHKLVTKLHGVTTQKATVSLLIYPKAKC